MVKDDHVKLDNSRSSAFRLAAVLAVISTAVILLVLTTTSTTSFLRADRAGQAAAAEVEAATAKSTSAPPDKEPADLFQTWPGTQKPGDRKPDLLLFLTGQMHGYILPCGCSRPQLGGVQRRYNYLEKLRKTKGWPVVALDLGDIYDPLKTASPQALKKYLYAMKSLEAMNYAAVAIGQHETAKVFLDTIGEYHLNNKVPGLAANLQGKDNYADCIKSGVFIKGGQNGASPSVGVIAVMAPSVIKEIPNQNPPLKFDDAMKVLPDLLKKMNVNNPDLRVLLCQGSVEEAKEFATKFPEFNVILCLTKDEEPANKPDKVGDTLIVSVGHKGRYVGLVGVFKTNQPKQPFSLYYQLVPMVEEYETPKGKEKDQPVHVLLEKYTEVMKDQNYLSRFAQIKHPVQVEFPEAKYVGAQECQSCHKNAYNIWSGHKHSHAYKTLVDAKHPGNRQFDGECIVCHVTGFGYQSGFTSEKASANLLDVSCENCHGPASLHVDKNNKDRNSPKLLALMNPDKYVPDEPPAAKKRRLNRIDQFCQKCHDPDNDIGWDFAKKWPKVVHPSRPRVAKDVAPAGGALEKPAPDKEEKKED